MRHSKATLALIAIAVAAVCVSTDASSRGRSGGHHASGGGARTHAARPGVQPHFANRARVGVFLGAPLFFAPGFYHPYPVPYPAPGYVPQMEYIEQPPDPAYWYFCPGSNAYYPYVKQCPGGWQQVVPPPAASSRYPG